MQHGARCAVTYDFLEYPIFPSLCCVFGDMPDLHRLGETSTRTVNRGLRLVITRRLGHVTLAKKKS